MRPGFFHGRSLRSEQETSEALEIFRWPGPPPPEKPALIFRAGRAPRRRLRGKSWRRSVPFAPIRRGFPRAPPKKRPRRRVQAGPDFLFLLNSTDLPSSEIILLENSGAKDRGVSPRRTGPGREYGEAHAGAELKIGRFGMEDLFRE